MTSEQQQFFINSQKNGTHAARILGRMRILLLVDEGVDSAEIAKREHVCEQTVYNTLKRFVTNGGNIEDRSRSGRPEKLSGEVKAHIIATACTDAPKGRARWTLRLLANEVIKLTTSRSHQRFQGDPGAAL